MRHEDRLRLCRLVERLETVAGLNEPRGELTLHYTHATVTAEALEAAGDARSPLGLPESQTDPSLTIVETIEDAPGVIGDAR